MKKSKSGSSSRRKERSRSPYNGSKSKRARSRSRSREREKTREETRSGPRKTRWQAVDKADVSKNTTIPQPEAPKPKSGPPPRIRDLFHDKEKIVDLLFQSVTGAALQELIPDYLKNRPVDELKKLCLAQIKSMTDEVILQVISGKVDSSNKDEEKAAEKEEILKPEQPSPEKEKEEKKELIELKKKPEEESSSDVVIKVSESPQSTSVKEENAAEEENLIPLVIKDEIAKDLIQPERDAELLELEMRARAIRSLLKAKAQSSSEMETKED